MDRRSRKSEPRGTQPVTIGEGPAGVGTRIEGLEQDSASTNERVAKRAYQRFEDRGGQHGHDMEDWLEAERELMNINEEE